MIHVERLDDTEPLALAVVVREEGSESRHRVTLPRQTLDRLAPGHTAEQCVAAAFRFLLDREPKESILSDFELTVIGRYFPEFERELADYLPPC